MRAPSTSRPPRLSHRSRAGCWTCRGRKVKCDEAHPRCGPCTRLNRDCDWDHRWNFSDATTRTTGKHSHVNISGNAVWDPAARPSSRSRAGAPRGPPDDLPEFAVLTNDGDRERKAVTQRPGTYGVVVTPRSFHDLPEYAAVAAASSPASSPRTRAAVSSRGRRRGGSRDPNTIILDRFEPESPPISASQSQSSRRRSYPEEAPHRRSISSDDHLIRHFRRHIVPRVCHPQPDLSSSSSPSSSAAHSPSTADVLEREARAFPPLHHAMCAVSALNLSHVGRGSLERAMQHYGHALATPATADLLSDAVFFRHLLLFVYDICCIPTSADDGSSTMWADHLKTLRQLATQRHKVRGHDARAHASVLWTICQLDMYACLMGSGTCEFVQTVTQNNMLPAIAPPHMPSPLALPPSPDSRPLFQPPALFPFILRLNQGVVLRTATLAQTAQTLRAEAPPRGSTPIPPAVYARWQATAASLQHDLHTFWQHAYPHRLGRDSIAAASALPDRARAVFETAILLYHTATIYARTSMFPGQRQLPVASQPDMTADTDARARAILHLVSRHLEHRRRRRRRRSSSSSKVGEEEEEEEEEEQEQEERRRQHVFPIFMAGFATHRVEGKARAIALIKAHEGRGIGPNTRRTRQLLVAVCEEQRRRGAAAVEWLDVATARGLAVVNCEL